MPHLNTPPCKELPLWAVFPLAVSKTGLCWDFLLECGDLPCAKAAASSSSGCCNPDSNGGEHLTVHQVQGCLVLDSHLHPRPNSQSDDLGCAYTRKTNSVMSTWTTRDCPSSVSRQPLTLPHCFLMR